MPLFKKSPKRTRGERAWNAFATKPPCAFIVRNVIRQLVGEPKAALELSLRTGETGLEITTVMATLEDACLVIDVQSRIKLSHRPPTEPHAAVSIVGLVNMEFYRIKSWQVAAASGYGNQSDTLHKAIAVLMDYGKRLYHLPPIEKAHKSSDDEEFLPAPAISCDDQDFEGNNGK